MKNKKNNEEVFDVLTLRIPKGLKDELKGVAKERDRYLSSLVRLVLRQTVREHFRG